MIPMRFREVKSCGEHRHTIIVLEDPIDGRTLAIAADPEESQRLVREVFRGAAGKHPVYDFVEDVVRAFGAAPAHVVLECEGGAGLGGAVAFPRPEGEMTIACYPSDAIALARRWQIPIYVSPDVFSHVRLFAPPDADGDPPLAEWLEQITPDDFSSSPG